MSDFPNNAFRTNPDLDENINTTSVPDRRPAGPSGVNTDLDATVGYDMNSPEEPSYGGYKAGNPANALSGGDYYYGESAGRKGGHAGGMNTGPMDMDPVNGSRVNSPAGNPDVMSSGKDNYSQARYGRDQSTYRNPPPYPSDDFSGGGRRDRGRKEKKVKAEKGNSFGKRILKTIATALIFGLVAGAAFSGVNHFMGGGSSGSSQKTEKSQPSGGGSDSQKAQVQVTAVDYTQVVEDVMPSVVAITGTFTQQGWFGQTYSGEGAGSGFITEIADNEILIGTNNHVVEGGENITVLFNDDTSVPATVVGTDKDSDLAVVSVKRTDVTEDTIKAIKAVTFSEEEVKVGQSVIAIGNALGYGQSVTTGVISAKNRRVSFTDGSMTLLQTDAAINPGNSGGILINTSGQVVGINNAKLEDTSVEGMCYAIPVSRAVPILGDLKESGTVDESEQAYLGIHGQTVDASYSEMYDIPAGVVVSSVIPDSPAEKAGLQAGDVIVSFDGNEISTMEGLQNRISHQKAGEKIAVTIKRKNGEKYEDKDLTVTMGKKSDMPQTSQNQEPDTQDPDNGNDQYDQYNWEDILPYIFGN